MIYIKLSFLRLKKNIKFTENGGCSSVG